jgi:hypothetical protein
MAETEYKPERYQVILDRSPFGADPLTGVAAQDLAKQTAAANAAAKQLEKELRLCFLLETETGEIRAGFENKTARPGEPKSVLLMVGESFKGMKLLEIDLPGSMATLLYQGKRVAFELSKSPTAAKAKKAPTTPQTPQRRFGGGFRRREPPAAPPAEPALSPEEQKRLREETRENMRQYQMEVIRAGMPPLPIPLTQEMDDQLVAEGILPPEQ